MEPSQIVFLVFGVLVLAFFAIAIVFIRHNRYAAEEEYQEGLLRQERPKPTAKNGRGTFTIGESTTYISGPLDENGHIDYPAALDAFLSKGVRPEDNAAVLLWQALGPNPAGTSVPREFFERLGIPAPPPEGEYFIHLEQYSLTEWISKKIAKIMRIDHVPEALDRLTRRAWTEDEAPTRTAWLNANEEPLALVFEAPKREHYYYSHATPRNEKGSTGLISIPWAGLLSCRAMTGALATRAMLFVGHGVHEAAWQDLLACHRLGRLVARGGMLFEALVGIAIEHLAARSLLAFLFHTKPDTEQLEGYRNDLASLPPPPNLAEQVDVGERFFGLDLVMTLDRQGLSPWKGFGKVLKSFGVTDAVLHGIDWDPALEILNRGYDQVAAAYRAETRAERVRQLDLIEDELRGLNRRLTRSARRTLRDPSQSSQVKGQVLGEVLMSCSPPMWKKMQDAADLIAQVRDNVGVALALELYQRENGRYPEGLDSLVPKYLDVIPRDVFSGNPLIYNQNANGYRLYSVGPNGQDDGGLTAEEKRGCDDIVVRMPPR